MGTRVTSHNIHYTRFFTYPILHLLKHVSQKTARILGPLFKHNTRIFFRFSDQQILPQSAAADPLSYKSKSSVGKRQEMEVAYRGRVNV